MEELVRASLPFLVPAMLPVVVMLLAPLLRRRARTWLGAGMAILAAAFIADIVVVDHSEVTTAQVPTVFGRGPEPALHVWVVDEVSAPLWHWHVVAAAYFGIAALVALLGRGREPRAPRPVLTAVSLFGYVLAARLALEKTAAHTGVFWAVGTSAAVLCIAPFFGYYCGARGLGFGRWVGAWLVANVLQRLLLVAVAFVATTRQLGTHLDVHRVTEVTPLLIGETVLEGPTEAWLFAIAIPQLVFALIGAFVIGIVLGLVPWWLGSRHRATGQKLMAA